EIPTDPPPTPQPPLPPRRPQIPGNGADMSSPNDRLRHHSRPSIPHVIAFLYESSYLETALATKATIQASSPSAGDFFNSPREAGTRATMYRWFARRETSANGASRFSRS